MKIVLPPLQPRAKHPPANETGACNRSVGTGEFATQSFCRGDAQRGLKPVHAKATANAKRLAKI